MADQDPYGNYQADLRPYTVNQPALVTFIIPVAGNPNSLGTTTVVVPAMALDTVGLVLYETQNGTTWTAISGGGGGGGTTQVLSGHGAPVSTPTNDQIYVDLDTSNLWSWANGGPWNQLTSNT